MSKSYNGLFDRMLTDEAMDLAFHDAAHGKRNRKDVKAVFEDYDNCKNELRQMLLDGSFQFLKHKPCIINEYSCQKERKIVKPHYKYEQVVHHLLVGQLKPIIMKSLYEYSCGSIPGRGCHYGKRHMERWIKRYPADKPLFAFKWDIYHFFESIDRVILKSQYDRIIRDVRFLSLLFALIDLDIGGVSNEDSELLGLALGFYPSQWSANFNLSGYDHYVKEVLKAPEYMRYMDDMVALSDSKEQLHEIRIGAEEYLNRELNLKVKDNWQIFPILHDMQDEGGRALDYMGFKFYRNHTTLRKSILMRTRRKANKIHAKIVKGEKVNFRDAASMISRLGWIDSTDTYNYYLKYIKPKVTIRRMKYKVSRYQRKENRRNDRLEDCTGFTGFKTPRSGYYLFAGFCLSEKEYPHNKRSAAHGRAGGSDPLGVRGKGNDEGRILAVPADAGQHGCNPCVQQAERDRRVHGTAFGGRSFSMKGITMLVESLKRLYAANRVEEEKLRSMVAKGVLDEEDFEYVTGIKFTVNVKPAK